MPTPDTTDFLYTPDLSRPIEPEEDDKGGGGRLTFQASSKDKFTFSYDKQRNFQDQLTGQLETGTIKNEANQGYCQRHQVMQGTWSRPQSNNLLFDAGMTVSKFNFQGFGEDLFLSDYEGCGGQLVDNVSINDTGLGFTYNGVGVGRGMSLSHQSNGRFNVSLITRAAHASRPACSGCTAWAAGSAPTTSRAPAQVNGLPVTYTFLNSRPTSAHAVRVAQPAGRPAQPRSRSFRAGPVAAEAHHDQCGSALRLAPRVRGRVLGARGRAGAPAVVPGASRTSRTGRTSARGSASCGIPQVTRRPRSSSASTATSRRRRRASPTCSIRSAPATRCPARRERGAIRTATSFPIAT